MENIDGFTILSGVLVALVAVFASVGVVYLALNTVAHAIITARKAKRHPMGYYTGTTRRQIEQPDMSLDGLDLRDKTASRKS